MDVSWKRKKTINGTNGGGVNLVAELVDNYHTAGNTEGNITTQLGIIGEKFLNSKARDMRAFHQGIFWVAVDKRLEQLNLDAKLRNRIEADILKTVSRPDDDWALWGVTCIPRFDP